MSQWQQTTLGECCEMYQPKTIAKKQMVLDGEYPVYGANGIIGRYDEYNHEEPQLLITCRGATCGSVNVSRGKCWINGNAMVIRPLSENLSLEYLTYYFQGGVDIGSAITGAAQPQITRKSLNPIVISFPSLSQQERIVEVLDEASELVKGLREGFLSKLAGLEELKQSVLEKAFAGELTDSVLEEAGV